MTTTKTVIQVLSTPYLVLPADDVIKTVPQPGASTQIVLPDPVANPGRIVTVFNKGQGETVVQSAAGVYGRASLSLYPGQGYDFASDGVSWDPVTTVGSQGGGPPGPSTWGGIGGPLSSQTDLQTALNAKQATLSDSGTWLPKDNTIFPAALAPSVIPSYPAGSLVSLAGQRWERIVGGNESVFTRSAWKRHGAINPLGLYVPDGWGTSWFAKLQAAATGGPRATLGIISDSVGRGYYSGTLDGATNGGYIAQVRAALQTYGGDGGSGFKGGIDASTAFAGVYGATEKAVLSGAQWTFLSTGGAQNSGPGGSIITVPNGNTGVHTATFTVRGDDVGVWYFSAGPFSYTVDGVAGPAITQNVFGPMRTHQTGYGKGVHTVVVTVPNNNPTAVYIYGAYGENTTGVIVNNFSAAGYGTSQWAAGLRGNPDNNAIVASNPVLWSVGTSYSSPADAVIIGLGGNDAALSHIAPDSFDLAIRSMVEQVRDSVSTDIPIMMLFCHIGRDEGTTVGSNALYHEYALRGRVAAELYGAAYVNFWALGGNSYARWQSLNYWGTDGTPGVDGGTSVVHPGTLGHRYMASVVAPVLCGV